MIQASLQLLWEHHMRTSSLKIWSQDELSFDLINIIKILKIGLSNN